MQFLASIKKVLIIIVIFYYVGCLKLEYFLRITERFDALLLFMLHTGNASCRYFRLTIHKAG